jgi:hypothetical protein
VGQARLPVRKIREVLRLKAEGYRGKVSVSDAIAHLSVQNKVTGSVLSIPRSPRCTHCSSRETSANTAPAS